MLTPLYALSVGVLLVVFAWSVYNLPILIAGFHSLRKSKRKIDNTVARPSIPTFSIVVPVKNEANVVGRLLKALLKLNYPNDKYEVIIAEDGSSDGTFQLCKRFAEDHPNLRMRVFTKAESIGKPSALNFGAMHAVGDIIGFFDADSVPHADVLLNAASYFEVENVAGVQGRTISINSEDNMLTKFASYEDSAWS